eukprot:767286-Hanusia_phi.AAC.8
MRGADQKGVEREAGNRAGPVSGQAGPSMLEIDLHPPDPALIFYLRSFVLTSFGSATATRSCEDAILTLPIGRSMVPHVGSESLLSPAGGQTVPSTMAMYNLVTCFFSNDLELARSNKDLSRTGKDELDSTACETRGSQDRKLDFTADKGNYSCR